jgi:glycosyltransferase involved in cell wall biosynthesis
MKRSSGVDSVPETLIVIPHYGSDQLIHDLFLSIGFSLPADSFRGHLTRLDQPSYSFLVVNNNHANAGFTAACNQGLKSAREPGWGFDFVWLLNNDTLFERREQFEHSLRVLLSLAKTRDWGIVSQQVRHAGRPDHIVFGGARECFPAGRHKSGLVSRGDWAVPSEERWLSFCSVLVQAELIARIGPMDEAFVNYFSDSDYSLEARLAGVKIGYAGKESFVFHRVGQSANPSQAQKRVLDSDYIAFWKKWIGGPRHAEYLHLMGGGQAAAGDACPPGYYRAEDLAALSGDYPELRPWLETLPGDQLVEFKDILHHFQHAAPPTSFCALCNIILGLMEAT